MMNRILRYTLFCGLLAPMALSLGCSSSVTMPEGSITFTQPPKQLMVNFPTNATRPTQFDINRQASSFDPETGGKK